MDKFPELPRNIDTKIITRRNIDNTKCLIGRDLLEWQRHKGFSEIHGRVCAFVDCSLHDVAGVSNAFNVNGSGYFSSASIFGESTATVDLWATINYESPIEARGRPRWAFVPRVTHPRSFASIQLARVPLTRTQLGIESATFKEEHPCEFDGITICRWRATGRRIKGRDFASPTLPAGLFTRVGYCSDVRRRKF